MPVSAASPGQRWVRMSGRPPRFSPIRVPKVAVPYYAPKFRGSPRRRGYDARWDRLSIAHRRLHPFCRLCEQEGNDGLADRVDHILPRVEYPGLMYEPTNLQSLCNRHDGIKQSMEVFARKNGVLERLTLWCSSLENRPPQFRGGIHENKRDTTDRK